MPIQVGWILTTTVIVLFLAGFGTYELVQPEGAGGAQGPMPHLDATFPHGAADSGDRPAVEVHLSVTDLRGFETTELVIPDNTTVAFHVTSAST